MIVVHVEVVTLEGVPMHTSVDRVEVSVFAVVVLIEVDDHLEGGNVRGVEDNIVAVGANLRATHVRCVVVASVGDFTMEEELERRLRPW